MRVKRKINSRTIHRTVDMTAFHTAYIYGANSAEVIGGMTVEWATAGVMVYVGVGFDDVEWGVESVSDDGLTAHMYANLYGNMMWQIPVGWGTQYDEYRTPAPIATCRWDCDIDNTNYTHYHWDGASMHGSVSISGVFDLWAEWDDSTYTHSDIIHKAYSTDHDTYGIPPVDIKYWYAPAGAITLTYESDGHTWTWDFTPQYPEIFNCGLPTFTLDIGGTDTGHQQPNVLSATATFSGDGPVTHGNRVSSSSDGSATLNGDTITTKGGYSVTYTNICGSYTVEHTGLVQHMDGTVVPGVEVLSSEGTPAANATTGPSGVAIVDHYYEGAYDWETWDGNSASVTDGVDRTTKTHTHYAPVIGNCYDMGEPDFPLPFQPPKGYESGEWFRDARTEIKIPDFSWNNCLTFHIPYSRDAVVFNTASGWTVESGQATMTYSRMTLNVTATTDCVISKDFSSAGVTLAGARDMNLSYTTGDSDPITMTVDNRDYKINPGTPKVDILAPMNQSGTDVATQTAWSLNGSLHPSWGWGIHNPGTIKFHLKAGNTYRFSKITMCRREAEAGGYAKVIITDGAFVGSSPGDGRQTDPHSMYVFSEGHDNVQPVYFNRKGFVIVDGIVAAEIFDVKHWLTSTSANVYWNHQSMRLSDPGVLYPVGGQVSMTVNSYGEGQQWKTMVGTTYQDTVMSDLPVTMLKAGTYDTNGGVDTYADWELRAGSVEIPIGMTIPIFRFEKTLRGMGLLRVVDSNGASMANADVTVDTRLIAGGPVVSTWQGNTNDRGECWLPSLKQPQIIKAQITAKYSSTDYGVSPLGRDYTGFSVFYAGHYPEIPQWGKIQSHNLSTNRIVLKDAPLYDPAVGDYFYFQLDYPLSIKVHQNGRQAASGVFDYRNRCISFMTMKMLMSGPLYGPTTIMPHYHGGSSNHPEYL